MFAYHPTYGYVLIVKWLLDDAALCLLLEGVWENERTHVAVPTRELQYPACEEE